MFIKMMLLAAAGWQVIGSDGQRGLVRATAPIAVGETLAVRRLEPVAGAPGRLPLFQWRKAGMVRVVAIRADGVAEVALLRGRLATGDRIWAD